MKRLFVIAALAVCRPAFADPITAGQMLYATPPAQLGLSVSGDRFTFDGGFRLSEHLWGPNESCRLGFCHPGDALNFGGMFQDATEIFGTFMLDGRTFPITGGVSNERLNLDVAFNSTLMAPTDVAVGPLTLTAPFSFTGSFLWYDIFDNVPTNPHLTFTGAGTLTAVFDYRNFEFPGQNQLFLHSASYDFAPPAPTPTPEPGTLLLMATGLVGAVVRRVRAQ